MKKILLFIFGAVILTSCHKDLDVLPTQYVTSDRNDEIAAEDPVKAFTGVEVGIYTRMAAYFNGDHVLCGQKGFELMMGQMGMDLPLLMQHSQNWFDYTIDYRDEMYNRTGNLWTFFYENISDANRILITLGLVEDDEYTDEHRLFEAKALTARAWCYYYLVNLYQYPYSSANKDLLGVPLQTAENFGEDQPRSTVQQVYDMMVADLDEAIKLFDQVGHNALNARTEININVARLVRGRVALFLAPVTPSEWNVAVEMADGILDTYELIPSTNIHNGFNDVQKVESLIWGFKMSPDNASSYASWVSQMDPYDIGGYASLWAERPIFSYRYAKIPATDVRRAWWLNEVDNPNVDFPGDPSPCQLPDLSDYGVDKGLIQARSEYVSVKFFAKNGTWDDSDLVYVRAEEAVFIKAEAQVHGGDVPGGVQTLVNWVRAYRDPAYAFSTSNAEEAISEINFQKRIEMWMEGGLEYMDNRRLGIDVDRRIDADFEAAYDVENNHIDNNLYPITSRAFVYQLPRSVVRANPHIGQENQNP